MIKFLLIGLGCLLVVFAFMLYVVLKTSSTDISKYAPFQAYVGRSVTLQRSATLFRQDDTFVENRAYPYSMVDTAHRQWQYFQDGMAQEKPEVSQVDTLPPGTTITIDKAMSYRSGVSGFSSTFVFGRVLVGDKTYYLSYRWGDIDLAKLLDKQDAYWTFDRAPWQMTADSSYYALPHVGFW